MGPLGVRFGHCAGQTQVLSPRQSRTELPGGESLARVRLSECLEPWMSVQGVLALPPLRQECAEGQRRGYGGGGKQSISSAQAGFAMVSWSAELEAGRQALWRGQLSLSLTLPCSCAAQI